MPNLAGKAYALTVISPQRFTWLNRLIYAVFRCLPDRMQVLHNLNIIHFARWVLLPADRWPSGWRSRHGYVLFASNFNSTWDAYLDEFSDILALGLDGLWYQGIGFPKSLPSTPFKAYIDHNSFDAGLYYNATPGHAVRDVNNAFLVRAAIAHLERSLQRLDADPALSEADRDWRFQQEFDQVFRALANRLPTPGRAPLAQQELLALQAGRRARIGALERLSPPFGFLPPHWSLPGPGLSQPDRASGRAPERAGDGAVARKADQAVGRAAERAANGAADRAVNSAADGAVDSAVNSAVNSVVSPAGSPAGTPADHGAPIDHAQF